LSTTSTEVALALPGSRHVHHALKATRRCLQLENQCTQLKHEVVERGHQLARMRSSLQHATNALSNTSAGQAFTAIETTLNATLRENDTLKQRNAFLEDENETLIKRTQSLVEDVEVLSRHRGELLRIRSVLERHGHTSFAAAPPVAGGRGGAVLPYDAAGILPTSNVGGGGVYHHSTTTHTRVSPPQITAAAPACVDVRVTNTYGSSSKEWVHVPQIDPQAIVLPSLSI